jgi:hypothetical protein
MKLYLIHTGFYDKNVADGFYEQHTNILIVASSVYDAREKVKGTLEYKYKKMHIDGIKEIVNVDGYTIGLEKTDGGKKNNTFNHYEVRFLKSESQ